jgi:hypothetical protein
MQSILLFFNCCLETEVSKQLYYENVTEINIFPVSRRLNWFAYTKKAVTRETGGRYIKADKKKRLMPNRFVKLTGYNRKYAIRLLSRSPAKTAAVAGREKPSV